MDACVAAGVERYVLLSSMSADDPMRGSEGMRHYLAAMHARERLLRASGLAATIVRPGGLTHDEPTGLVRVGIPNLEERGQIPRADVAAVMAGCLMNDETIGATFSLISGDTPIADALAEVARARA